MCRALLFLGFVSMVGVQAKVGSSLTRHDIMCYGKFNPDVVASVGNNVSQLRQHWLDDGINEGRRGPGPCRLPNEPVSAVSPAVGPIIDLPCRMLAEDCKINPASRKMPALGFGTCCRASSTGPALIDSVLDYIVSGGRLIDTAQLYGNHKDIARAIDQLPLKREDLWITTKLNTEGCCPAGSTAFIRTNEEMLSSVKKVLYELKVRYVDLLLLHHQSNETKVRVDLWKSMIEIQRAGLARNIGVSNYGSSQMQELFDHTGIFPSVNQIEFHPWVPAGRYKLLRWCKDHNIAVTAFGSLGGYGNNADGGDVLRQLAKRQNMTTSQLLILWSIQKGIAVIPGATSPSHIQENLKVAKDPLSDEDLALIRNASKPSNFKLWTSYDDDFT